jgi:tungstate transport system ATP-binding protein
MADTFTYRLRALQVERTGCCILDLADLTLTGPGVTAIVGPNGAGKTTLLRVLAFLQCPTRGEIEFRDRTVQGHQLAALRQQVTFVAQSPLLFRRSVRANVGYGLRVRGMRAQERVEAALAAVGLAGFGERPAWKLSGGEAQRVAIARALAIDPAVYLFDEPTANVDRQHVAVIEALIGALGAAQKTVIVSMHDLEQAYRLSDRLVTLTEGRVAPFPLANLLRGRSARAGDASYFLSEPLRIEMPDGSPARSIAIDPDDIIVSREPLHSSARNCFPGRIVKVERGDPGIFVTVDCGQPLVARITQHSYDELALTVGAAVYVTFKSSAIHVVALD